MGENSWIDGDNAGQIESYLDFADVVLIERRRTIRILMDLFRYHFDKTEGLSLFDIGCGDGILSRNIHSKYPHNQFHLMDGAEPMLVKAKALFPGDNVRFTCSPFEDYISAPASDSAYDFAYSANAIHHLDLEQKRQMYAKVYQELRPGGMFINVDAVQPTSEQSEAWQFRMWTDWMNENLTRLGRNDEVGSHDELPAAYKDSEENKPSALSDQLTILSELGFGDVDCFYKYSVFAVFGGTKT